MSCPPRVMPRLVKLLNEGATMNKYLASSLAYCDQRTAQRVLGHLWIEGYVRIIAWTRSEGAPIPSYAKADGRPDAKRPEALPQNFQRDTNAEKREEINARRRMARAFKKQQTDPVRLGLWNL